MEENVKQIIVRKDGNKTIQTRKIWQYDVGHELVFEGFDTLPEVFQVHFSHNPAGDAVTQIGQNCVCLVPDSFVETAAPIYAWIYVAEEDTGLTKQEIEIPVGRKSKPNDQEPEPVEQSAIDQAIAALNAGVERAEDAAEAAETAQAGAEAAEQGASAAEDSAGASAALAAQKAELATQEANRAEAAEGIVEQAARDAVEDVTEVAEQAAADLGGIVRDAQTQIAGSVQQAQQAAQAASGSATAAAGSAGAAAGSATAADQSAQAAAQKKEQMDARADEIEDELTSLMSDIESKQDSPSVAGTAGQVLGLDANLSPVWVDQTGGTVDDSALAPVIKSTASGEIASFPDGADGRLIDSLVVNVEPVQDLHGYDHPWPAGGGKNKLPYLPNAAGTYFGVTVSYDSGNNAYVLNGTYTGIGNMSLSNIPKDQLPIQSDMESGARIMSVRVVSGSFTIPDGTGSTYAVALFNSNYSAYIRSGNTAQTADQLDGHYGRRATGLASDGDYHLLFQCWRDGTVFNNLKIRIQLEEADSTSALPTAWTPYENICPISGWTEANVWDDPKHGGNVKWNQLINNNTTQSSDNGLTYKRTGQKITVTGTVSSVPSDRNKYNMINVFNVIKDHKYLILKTNTNTTVYMYNAYTIGIVKETRFTTATQTGDIRTNIRFENVWAVGDIINEEYYFSVYDLTEMFGAGNEPSTVEEFKALFPKEHYPFDDSYTETCVSAVNGDPYKHIQIEFPSEAGTVFGADLSLFKDGTGELVVNLAEVDMGSLNWTYRESIAAFSSSLLGYKKAASGSEIPNILSSAYKTVAIATMINTKTENGVVTVGRQNAWDNFVLVRNKDYTDAAAFKAAVTGQQLVYELATLQTYTLTAEQISGILSTLKGMNNIWADCGGIESVEHSADTKLYIDNQITKAIAAALNA